MVGSRVMQSRSNKRGEEKNTYKFALVEGAEAGVSGRDLKPFFLNLPNSSS